MEAPLDSYDHFQGDRHRDVIRVRAPTIGFAATVMSLVLVVSVLIFQRTSYVVWRSPVEA
jgi:hypothetical protein